MTTAIPLDVTLDEVTVKNALAQLKDWFPTHAKHVDEHHDDLVEHIMNKTAPHPDSPLGQLGLKPVTAVSKPVSSFPAPAAGAELNLFSLGGVVSDVKDVVQDAADELVKFFTPCLVDAASAIVKGGIFVMSMMQIPVMYNSAANERFIRSLGLEALNGFSLLIREFRLAESLSDKAGVIFKIAGQFFNCKGFVLLFEEWAKTASWLDWITTMTIAVAQLIAWFATEMIAFVAQVILSASLLIPFEQSCEKAYHTCFGSAPVSPAAGAKADVLTPGGSYTFTAAKTAVTLSASCKDKAGNDVASTLNITGLPASVKIKNNNGKLETDGYADSMPATYKPLGSYADSAKDIKVLLTAEVKRKDGTPVSSALDITDLAVGKTVSNDNGVLIIDGSVPEEKKRHHRLG